MLLPIQRVHRDSSDTAAGWEGGWMTLETSVVTPVPLQASVPYASSRRAAPRLAAAPDKQRLA